MKQLKNVSDYWLEALREEHGLGYGEEIYFKYLLDLAKQSNKILEIGVGKGRMVKVLKDHNVGADFYGLDLFRVSEDREFNYFNGDARSLPFSDDSFDLVYSLGVIEHFPETQLSIQEHARVVKKGGYVVVTVPHICIFTPLRYLLYLMKERKFGSFQEIRGRNMRLSDVKKMFRESQLSITKSGLYGLYGIGTIIKKINLEFIQHASCIGSYLYVIGQK